MWENVTSHHHIYFQSFDLPFIDIIIGNYNQLLLITIIFHLFKKTHNDKNFTQENAMELAISPILLVMHTYTSHILVFYDENATIWHQDDFAATLCETTSETGRPWRFAITRNTPNFTTVPFSFSPRPCITITIIMTVIKVRPHLFAGSALYSY